MQFRAALWASDGDTDAVIHAGPSECGLRDFTTDTTDKSVIAAWNRRAPPAVTAIPPEPRTIKPTPHPNADIEAAVAGLAAPVEQASAEPIHAPIITTDEAREYLVEFMMAHFTDKTFHRYIRGQRGAVNLAGDFAWQMARALMSLQTAAASIPPLQAPDRQEIIGVFAIEVEKMLCKALGREWSVSGISIESLIAELAARSAPESVRDAAAQRLLRAAKVYTFNYLQDEHEEPELCTCGPKQHAELTELFSAISAMEGKAQ